MKGEANATIAERFRAMATPEELEERHRRAVLDRERYRAQQQKKAKDAKRS